MACRVVASSCERIVIVFVARYFASVRKFFFFSFGRCVGTKL